MIDAIHAFLQWAGMTLFFGVMITFYTLVIWLKAARHIHKKGCRHCEREKRRRGYRGRTRIRFTEAQRN